MIILASHVDREGYIHAEVQAEKLGTFAKQGELPALMHKLKINTILDFDEREEDGFEFWHIKGV